MINPVVVFDHGYYIGMLGGITLGFCVGVGACILLVVWRERSENKKWAKRFDDSNSQTFSEEETDAYISEFFPRD